MKYGQNVENLVARICVDASQCLRGIGKNIAMRKHDAFWDAFRAGREEHDCRVFRAPRAICGRPPTCRSTKLIEEADASTNVFEIDNRRLRHQCGYQAFQLGFFNERA